MKDSKTVSSEDTLEIAKNIASLINYKIQKQVDDDMKWKEHYLEAINEIEDELVSINESLDTFDKHQLTTIKIESEGYKRALVSMLNHLKSFQPK